MGQVYRATDRKTGTTVAVKLIRAELAGLNEISDRFEREVTLTHQLQHRNIVDFVDGGTTSDGTRYLVTRYLRGQTLAEVLDTEGALAPARAIVIARQVLAALSVAHRQGIVHRDIKPANVFLCPDASGAQTVKVLDFGLAWIANEPACERLTRRGTLAGTPHYMSPEQVTGDVPGVPSDLYSVGVLLFEMLTGEVPFDEENAIEAMIAHLNAAPPTPDWAALGVPARVGRVIQRCLEKDPSVRPACAGEVTRALDSAQDAGRRVSGATTRRGNRIRTDSTRTMIMPPGIRRLLSSWIGRGRRAVRRPAPVVI